MATLTPQAAARSPVNAYVEGLLARFAGDRSGAVADYIPELAVADPDRFGICIATVDGHVYEAGDSREPFTIQSMSKPFTYGLALEDHGRDGVAEKIGVEPSGDAFNEISLELGSGRPLNPMINAGAITATSLVAGDDPRARLLEAFSCFAGRGLEVDEAVYASERATGFRNFAIGYMLRTFGILEDDPAPVLDLYFRQCAIAVDCRDISVMAATLANGGVNPVTGERALRAEEVDRVLSVMTTCGMYDASGDWVAAVGMPAKSGVSGGILAVLPGQVGIGVFSPRLDARGNSVRGVAVCRALSTEQELHFLSVARSSRSALRAWYDVASVPSKRRRTPPEAAVLQTAGTRAVVAELQGDVLFAGAERVVRKVVEADEVELAVLDVRAASQVSAPAASLLVALRRVLQDRGGELVVVGAGHHRALVAALASQPMPLQTYFDVDVATEWCENRLLARYGPDLPLPDAVPLREHGLAEGLTDEDVAALGALLEPRSYAPGEAIVTIGDEADAIFLLVRGEVSVSIPAGEGSRRLVTLVPGMTFGELAVVNKAPRSAEVRADEPAELLVLPAEAFDALADTNPRLRALLLQNLLHDALERVARLTREVATLSGGR